jgi:glutamine synthetase
MTALLPAAEGAQQAQKLAAELVARGVRYCQLEMPDLDGGMRAKLVSVGKALAAEGAALCSIVFGLTAADDVYESGVSSYANGFPDLFACADLATVRVLPWRPSMASAVCDLRSPAGGEFPLAPRTVLRRVTERCRGLGYEPRFAVEYEAFVLHADPGLIAAGRHHELRPLGRTPNAYSSLRLADVRELGQEFMDRMSAIDAPVDSFHTELGYGMVEFALAHAPALDAADRAARAKAYFKELCAERGLVATFMAKWKPGESGSGAHVHQSLWRHGQNAFALHTGDGSPARGDTLAGGNSKRRPAGGGTGLSALARQYAAGQLATMPAFTPIFNPNVNSYRRISVAAWTPENATWGMDNRTAAVRAIAAPGPNAVRLEHRRAGADANPYLVIAAALAGGLYGVEARLEPPEPCGGNAAEDSSAPPLPASLPDATAALRGSDLARELLGSEFVEHYALSRQVEWDLWTQWLNAQVTEWELRRYFEVT